MLKAIDTSLIGLKATLDQLERTGQLIAKLTSDSDAVRDQVELTLAGHAFKANAAVVKASDEVLGTVVDLKT